MCFLVPRRKYPDLLAQGYWSASQIHSAREARRVGRSQPEPTHVFRGA